MKPITQKVTLKTASTTLVALFLRVASQASAMPVRQIPGLASVTYHERTGGSAPVAQTFLIDDPRMTTRLADPLSISNNDFAGVPDKEFYDGFYSDVDGTPNADGELLTIEGVFSATAPAGGALNLAEIALNDTGGATEYGLYVATFLARGDNAAPATVFNCMDGDLQTHTTMGKTGLGAVAETNETNNTDASPAIPALP
jgi:hypothetical protein